MLQYLDEDKPVKAIDLKDAVFMIAKAWGNATKNASKSCWRKAGFPGEVTEPTHDPLESDEEVEETPEESGLWGRLVQQYPSLMDVPFNQFASLDEDVVRE